MPICVAPSYAVSISHANLQGAQVGPEQLAKVKSADSHAAGDGSDGRTPSRQR
jgi:hypothetical protein